MEHNPFKIAFDSLEEFVDTISQVLQCPITIEDAEHRLIAYSSHDERTDQARISTIIGRRVPEKVINQLWKEGTIPTLLQTSEPVRVKNIHEIGLGDRVAISIWKQEEVIGFIWALEVDQRLDNEKLNLLKKAADAAKNELLQLQVRKRKKENRHQEFLWQLLTGHSKRKEEIINYFQALNIIPPMHFAIMVFKFQQHLHKKEEQQVSYLLTTSQQLQILLHTIDGQQLILFVSLPHSHQSFQPLDDFATNFKQNMQERFQITNIEHSISHIYDDYQKITTAYKESLEVLTIKESFPHSTEHIQHFNQLGIYQFFDVISEKQQKIGYENQALKKLYTYDLKHHSNLMHTLEIFLDKNTNMNDAAKALVVHPNSLAYRIKRITEISGIDFKDPNEKIMLYIDLKLHKKTLND